MKQLTQLNTLRTNAKLRFNDLFDRLQRLLFRLGEYRVTGQRQSKKKQDNMIMEHLSLRRKLGQEEINTQSFYTWKTDNWMQV